MVNERWSASNPLTVSAAMIRSCDSLTDVSGNPTIIKSKPGVA